jgi:hypothetical protein
MCWKTVNTGRFGQEHLEKGFFLSPAVYMAPLT